MNEHFSETRFDDESQWLAFQYVSGELSADDAESFELSMLENPALCDAVAEASLICCAVRNATANSPSVNNESETSAPAECLPELARTSVQHVNRGMWATLVSVCCCAVVALLVSNFAPTPSDQLQVAVQQGQSDAEQLVDVWIDGASVFSDNELDDLETSDNDLEVPDWLMTAVAMANKDQIEGDLPGDVLPGGEIMPDDSELF